MLLSTRITLILSFVIFSFSILQAAKFEWIGGSGEYDNPAMWDQNAIPSSNDDVFINISNITVTFPEGGTFYAGTFNVGMKCELFMKGNSGSENNFFIYGDINIHANAYLSYVNEPTQPNPATYNAQFNKWNLTSAGNFNLTTNNVAIGFLLIDHENADVKLLSALTIIDDFRISNGTFISNGNDINANEIYVRNYCTAGPTCPSITLNLNTSTINCSSRFIIYNHDAPVTVQGAFTLNTTILDAGLNINYENITISENQIGNGFINAYDNTIQNLTIDISKKAILKGRAVINGSIDITQESSIIQFNKYPVFPTTEWKIEGSITLPSSGFCTNHISFINNTEGDFNFSRNSGSIIFDNAFIKDIGTVGGGTFVALNSVVHGSVADWSIVNPAPSKDYYWVGGSGEWLEPGNWAKTSGGSPVNCIPGISDNVYFDKFSFSADNQTVEIHEGQSNQCLNFSIPSLSHIPTFEFLGRVGFDNELIVAGSVDINASANFIGNDGFLTFKGDASGSTISSYSGVVLPNLRFDNAEKTWTFLSNVEAIDLLFTTGTLNTNSRDLIIQHFTTEGNGARTLLLGNSTLSVIDKIDLGNTLEEEMVIDPGNSIIECERIESYGGSFNVLKVGDFNSNIYGKTDISKLIQGSGDIRMYSDTLSIDSLIFSQDLSDFIFQSPGILNILSGLESVAPGINPPRILSASGSQAIILHPKPNLCVMGPLELRDVNANLHGLMNAPQGIDLGNNTNISFNNSGYSDKLYWRGGSGVFTDLKNWANVSGGCPTEYASSLSSVPNLYFDNRSTIETDVITHNEYGVFQKLNFLPFDDIIKVELVENLLFRSLDIIGGSVKFNKTSNALLRSNSFVQIRNGGSLFLADLLLRIGTFPGTYSEKTLLVEKFSSLNLDNSSIHFLGTSFSGAATLEINPLASTTFIDSEIIIYNSFQTNINNDMHLYFGGHTIGNLYFDNQYGSTHQINIYEDVQVDEIVHNYGELKIKNGAKVTIY